jgi:UDPglucose 6-dehydrogenase
MRLTVIGTGYVGLVTGTCFAEMGNTVTCVDSDGAKVESLRQGEIPIYEPGLADIVKQNLAAGQLNFTGDMAEALRHAEMCFITVGTPMRDDGGADLSQVVEAAAQIGRHMTRDMIVVDKSTVPIGTAAKVEAVVRTELDARGVQFDVKFVSNPEFLKEGSAVADCMSPDRIIIGSPDEQTTERMKEVYSPFFRSSDRFIVMDVASAEMTKYAANAMLAARISFMNEIAGICEATGADVNMVRLGIGSDSRIGYSFLYAGCGYGGSCFPKDVQALIKTARDSGCEARILEQVEAVNQRQKLVLADKVVRRFGEDLNGKHFAVWGLSFKPGTDDIREATSLKIIPELLRRGARVTAYDPQAIDEAKRYLPTNKNLSYAREKYGALEGVDALLLVTEWKEFRSPDFKEMRLRMRLPIVFDGRNQYKSSMLRQLGFEYEQIGVGEGAQKLVGVY